MTDQPVAFVQASEFGWFKVDASDTVDDFFEHNSFTSVAGIDGDPLVVPADSAVRAAAKICVALFYFPCFSFQALIAASVLATCLSGLRAE